MASADQLRAAIEAHIAAVGAAEAARWRLSTPPTARCSAASPTRPIRHEHVPSHPPYRLPD
jgi:hypothetical protein